ncbi:DUF1642 domain-containing protein [Ligilactobacillus faecis]|uniref:DUF1642 domain-containing protein n=1 Tax=Ligilactobacillus faecis TaxID=762833 RepID=UPI002469C171|nr:DUF1642 domain-containing protein [Ligilactobacillus faecis]WGN89790.1 DUF1642 domain-containing protein [Ligilactobacillus faecis]
MTEEKDFWINKDEVSALSNAEGTLYKVTQKKMNRKGWHKLNSNEQIVKRVVLTPEEAEWFEKHKDLPFYNSNINLNFSYMLVEQAEKYSDIVEQDFINRMSQAYFTGYTTEKEKKYYIKPNFDYKYLRVNRYDGSWYWESKTPTPLGRPQFTQDEIDEMQKDPRAKGLDLNVLKVEVSEDELED